MKEIDRLAIKFCKECLDHPESYLGSFNGQSRVFGAGLFSQPEGFDPRNLSEVMDAAASWANRRDGTVTLSFASTSKKWVGIAHADTLNTHDVLHEDRQCAIMGACLNTNRELMER